jgi:hypothetical protein
MKLGAEPKKVAVLIGLVVVAIVVFLMNSGPGDDSAVYTPPARPSESAAASGAGEPAESGTAAVRQQRGRTSNEFRPSLRPKRGEQRPDPMTIDPTLRVDLLAKLQQVDVEGAHRSVFDFSQPPPPKPDPVKAAEAKPPVPDPIVAAKKAEPADEVKPEPAKPKAPPIPLKFYGYVSPAGPAVKRAFFMEGEEIHVVREGEVVKRRYKIVRIGVNSVVVEDTQFGSQQTLPLEEQQQG